MTRLTIAVLLFGVLTHALNPQRYTTPRAPPYLSAAPAAGNEPFKTVHGIRAAIKHLAHQSPSEIRSGFMSNAGLSPAKQQQLHAYLDQLEHIHSLHFPQVHPSTRSVHQLASLPLDEHTFHPQYPFMHPKFDARGLNPASLFTSVDQIQAVLDRFDGRVDMDKVLDDPRLQEYTRLQRFQLLSLNDYWSRRAARGETIHSLSDLLQPPPTPRRAGVLSWLADKLSRTVETLTHKDRDSKDFGLSCPDGDDVCERWLDAKDHRQCKVFSSQDVFYPPGYLNDVALDSSFAPGVDVEGIEEETDRLLIAEGPIPPNFNANYSALPTGPFGPWQQAIGFERTICHGFGGRFLAAFYGIWSCHRKVAVVKKSLYGNCNGPLDSDGNIVGCPFCQRFTLSCNNVGTGVENWIWEFTMDYPHNDVEHPFVYDQEAGAVSGTGPYRDWVADGGYVVLHFNQTNLYFNSTTGLTHDASGVSINYGPFVEELCPHKRSFH